MKIKKKVRNVRGQAGVEYMIIVGFVTFAVIAILALAFFYSEQIKDRIKANQIEGFAVQLVNSAESVFFGGEPSKTTVKLFLPGGVTDLQVTSNSLVVTYEISSGTNVREFPSDVPLQGTLSTNEGLKVITLEARETYVLVTG